MMQRDSGGWTRHLDPMETRIARWLGPPRPQVIPSWPPAGARRVDSAAVAEQLARLIPSPYPFVTFVRLAVLLVPAAADRIIVDILTGSRLTRWQPTSALLARVPTVPLAQHGNSRVDRSWNATLYVPGQLPTDGTGQACPSVPYVLALHCRWAGSAPTEADVIVIEAAGRSATRSIPRQPQAGDRIQPRKQRRGQVFLQ